MKSSRSKQPGAGSVRIIGGQWRRRRIALTDAPDMRPTPDRVRETLFNWLDPVLPGSACLDLFAGSGVLGFEALSRGAQRAVLVERDRAAAAALERVREELEAAAEIVCGEALGFLQRTPPGSFDIAFVDPPYTEAVDAVLAALPRVLKPGARLYLERGRDGPWPAAAGFDWVRCTTAGAVRFGLALVDAPACA